MADKPDITVTLRAAGMNRDGIRIDATVEGPAEEFERMKRKLDDVLYRNDAKPLEGQEREGEKKIELA